jgi:hypothetical protein
LPVASAFITTDSSFLIAWARLHGRAFQKKIKGSADIVFVVEFAAPEFLQRFVIRFTGAWVGFSLMLLMSFNVNCKPGRLVGVLGVRVIESGLVSFNPP